MLLIDAIQFINNQGFTAYEIHKVTGLNEAGLRRVLNNEVTKPQRKTRDAIIEFAKNNIIAIDSDTKKVEKIFIPLTDSEKLEYIYKTIQIIDEKLNILNNGRKGDSYNTKENEKLIRKSLEFQEDGFKKMKQTKSS